MLEDYVGWAAVLRLAFFLPLAVWLSIYDIRHQLVHPPAAFFLLFGALIHILLFRMDFFAMVEIAVLALMVLALWLLLRGKIGAGDVKLLFLFAMLFEPDVWSIGLLISGWLGLCYIFIIRVSGKKRSVGDWQHSQKVPFVPFLAGGYTVAQLILMWVY